jgi:hypothetical protein
MAEHHHALDELALFAIRIRATEFLQNFHRLVAVLGSRAFQNPPVGDLLTPSVVDGWVHQNHSVEQLRMRRCELGRKYASPGVPEKKHLVLPEPREQKLDERQRVFIELSMVIVAGSGPGRSDLPAPRWSQLTQTKCCSSSFLVWWASQRFDSPGPPWRNRNRGFETSWPRISTHCG